MRSNSRPIASKSITSNDADSTTRSMPHAFFSRSGNNLVFLKAGPGIN